MHRIAAYPKINYEILFEGIAINNINVKSISESTPLHIACLYANKYAIGTLLTHEADPNIGDNYGDNCIVYYYQSGRHQTNDGEILKLLVNSGLNLQVKDHNSQNVLHTICMRKEVENAKFLISQGCSWAEKV